MCASFLLSMSEKVYQGHYYHVIKLVYDKKDRFRCNFRFYNLDKLIKNMICQNCIFYIITLIKNQFQLSDKQSKPSKMISSDRLVQGNESLLTPVISERPFSFRVWDPRTASNFTFRYKKNSKATTKTRIVWPKLGSFGRNVSTTFGNPCSSFRP